MCIKSVCYIISHHTSSNSLSCTECQLVCFTWMKCNSAAYHNLDNGTVMSRHWTQRTGHFRCGIPHFQLSSIYTYRPTATQWYGWVSWFTLQIINTSSYRQCTGRKLSAHQVHCKQFVNLMCAQAYSASYPLWDGKWVAAWYRVKASTEVVICLLTAPWVQLSINMGNTWLHYVLWYH